MGKLLVALVGVGKTKRMIVSYHQSDRPDKISRKVGFRW
jgi:hypothetical protein